MIGHVDDSVRRGIERAITAIAAAVDLRVCARAYERREHRLKNFLFHRFSFFRAGAFNPVKIQRARQACSVAYSLHLSPMLPAKIQ
jgi:hypothetical protein